MRYPSGDEYMDAVGNPRSAFNDSELKNCDYEKSTWGSPRPFSGGFTTTYHLFSKGRDWAVRCFTRDVKNLQMRYTALSNFFTKRSCKYFVPASYVAEGVNVKGTWHPIIKMEWIHGQTLDEYIEYNAFNHEKMSKLAEDFYDLIQYLEANEIAHGDLQHGNVIIKDGELYLIDYDGIWLPELSSLRSSEIGHNNYQHPDRGNEHYNQYLDRFSSIVIYLGLISLSLKPDLVKYNKGENILFKSKDFLQPEKSEVFRELRSISDISRYTERFEKVCHMAIDDVPSLQQFIENSFTYNEGGEKRSLSSRQEEQYPIIDIDDIQNARKHIGLKVEVIGFLNKFKSAELYRHIRFHIGENGNYWFYCIIRDEEVWDSTLKRRFPQNINATCCRNNYFSVTGTLSALGKGNNMIPVIEAGAQNFSIISKQAYESKKLKISYIDATNQSKPLPEWIIANGGILE